jgi:hypothetical protein
MRTFGADVWTIKIARWTRRVQKGDVGLLCFIVSFVYPSCPSCSQSKHMEFQTKEDL